MLHNARIFYWKDWCGCDHGLACSEFWSQLPTAYLRPDGIDSNLTIRSLIMMIIEASIQLSAWISKYMYNMWGVITHQNINFNGGLLKPLLELWHGQFIIKMKIYGCYFIYPCPNHDPYHPSRSSLVLITYILFRWYLTPNHGMCKS